MKLKLALALLSTAAMSIPAMAGGRHRDRDDYRYNRGYAGRSIEARGVEACRSAVYGQLGNRVRFGDTTVDNRRGMDVVRGRAFSRGRDYRYACRVNPYNGVVRNLRINPR